MILKKNKEIDLDKITLGSSKKVWWKCDKGHEWDACVVNRNRGTGCPYCSGRKVISGINDLATINPILAKEWNYEKNGDLKPNMVTVNCGRKVWWKCKKGHEWEVTVDNRNRGRGCPFCGNKKILKGYNDLATVNPELVKEWNYKKNGNQKPNMFLASYSKKVWWICKNGHEWQATIINRSRGTGCPYCAGVKTIVGYNDLATVNPELIKEWNYEKNGDMNPNIISANTNKKVWWKCRKGHEWEAVISSRNAGNGCPYCAKELQTSFPEQAIYYYIKKIFPDAINSDHHLNMELDIFIPSKNIAIEYDGVFWHKNSKSDEKKNKLCEDNKIILFRVKENYNKENFENEYLKIVPCSYSDSGIKFAVEMILKYFNKEIDVNLDKNRANIYSMFIQNQKEHSLLNLNPILTKEWNYEKNGDLKPDMVTVSSGKKVWWKCDKGHEWMAVIRSRNDGSGCPYCANQKILKGYNDLKTVNPKLSKEWNYEKNNGLKPDMFIGNSREKVWWICENGHEWKASIINRTRGTSCPYCLGRQVIKGFNDLATLNPELSKEWNNEKNGNLKPDMVTVSCGKKVWWKCKNGHEWQGSIANRSKGSGCPICGNKIVLKGYNDLATINPKLAKEWNYERNKDLKPDMVTCNSNKKVWWICEKGHEWETYISNRNKGRGCAYCAGQKVISGENDLATLNPNLIEEWNYGRNKGINPWEVMSNSHKRVWWKCKNGHEWESTIANRNKGNGCPECKKINRKS